MRAMATFAVVTLVACATPRPIRGEAGDSSAASLGGNQRVELAGDEGEKRPSNYGSRGGPAHRRTVERRINELKAGGHQHVGGGELAEWLRAALDEFGAVAVLYRAPDVPLELWDSRQESLAGAFWVFVAERPVDLATARADDLHPGMWGWVHLDVPRSEGDALLISQVAVKSDWWDSEKQQVMNNPAGLKLFDKLWRRLKKHVKFPVWARDRVSGAEESYRDTGYSEAAARWFERGGQLRQWGVTNVEFIIRPATPGAGSESEPRSRPQGTRSRSRRRSTS